MSEWGHIALRILGICIYIIERCIVPQIAWNTMALRAWKCDGTYEYSDPGIGIGHLGRERKK